MRSHNCNRQRLVTRFESDLSGRDSGRSAETPDLLGMWARKSSGSRSSADSFVPERFGKRASSFFALHTLLASRVGARRLQYAVPLSGLLWNNHDLVVVALDVCPFLPQHSP